MALKGCVRQPGTDFAPNRYQRTSVLNFSNAPIASDRRRFFNLAVCSQHAVKGVPVRARCVPASRPCCQVMARLSKLLAPINASVGAKARAGNSLSKACSSCAGVGLKRMGSPGWRVARRFLPVFFAASDQCGHPKIFSASLPLRGSNRLSTVYITRSCATRFAWALST